jgi:hypothetical protein
MKIVDKKITIGELKETALGTFGNVVKAVVDVEKELIALDAELHSDLEALLLESGSKQKNIWGINLYPELTGDEFIEFDSLINIRPAAANRSRGVENEAIRKKIASIVNKSVIR